MRSLRGGIVLACAASIASAQASTPVTIDNFVRAETDLCFNNSVGAGGFDWWHHVRDLRPTVTFPDAGQRFMSLQNMVRLYRPRAEILDGKWKFPEAEPVM